MSSSSSPRSRFTVFALVFGLAAAPAFARDDEKPAAGKALRDAEAALGTTRRDKQFAAWEAEVRDALVEMEREVEAGRGDDLVRRYQLRLTQREDPSSRYLLGRLFGKLDRLEAARAEFERALVAQPDYAFAHEGLAIYHMKKGAPDLALKALEAALATNPKFDHARVTLGGILYNQKDYPRAIDELLKIPKDSAEYYGARLLIGQCRLARKEMDLAIAEFKLAQGLKPGDYEASYYAADAQRNTGDFDGAIATCESILAKKPDEFFAAYLAGRAYYEKGDYDKAKSSLQMILDKAPNGDSSGAARIDRDRVKALIDKIEGAQKGQPAETKVTVSDLIDQLEKDPDAKVRRKAIRILSSLEVPQLLPTYAKALLDKDHGVRVIAIREVGRFGGKDAISLARRLVKEDPNPLVRGAACGALAEIGESDGLESLVDALSDADSYVVDEAVRSISKLSGKWFASASAAAWDDAERARLVAEIRKWWTAEPKRRS
ncbi:MAG: HEAT repeat domain-containing protein [Planctomycetes bacterium]|nr:HEAT repeat domain-containing protein [Planctomycetota bacterium]MBI3845037.1 HEAT repeat domain-containing protein [Planctomycetota bacterium]